MKVVGIDVSTFAVDFALLELDSDRVTWERFELGDGDLIDRIRRAGTRLPRARSMMWDDVLAVGIERPAGRYGVPQVSMAVGAVLACLPADLLLKAWMPAEWRKACGLPGNASKEQVKSWAITTGWASGTGKWPQDACDAYAIAWATRAALELEEAA